VELDARVSTTGVLSGVRMGERSGVRTGVVSGAAEVRVKSRKADGMMRERDIAEESGSETG
jgi:hypothetical protein